MFGLYRGVWRFASLPDLTRIIKAIATGTLLSLGLLFLMTGLQNIPRSVFPLYTLLMLFTLGGSRLIYRRLKDKRYFPHTGHRVLIVGAGRAGESLVRDLLRDEKRSYTPVAFVDDDENNQGRELHRIRVVGTGNDIPEVVRRYAIDMILIALPSANASQMRRIVALCESTKKPVRTLPGMNDLVSGLVSIKNLREISLEDLLGRDPVTLDWEGISSALAHKVVLVSGGGGSIGSELCRQIIKCNPRQLIILDNSEYNLFCIQQELSSYAHTISIEYQLMDLCDDKAIPHLIGKVKPHIIFHAGAYKHVPLLEPQIRAAVKNNILGTYPIAKAAITHRVEKFVLVSTDKAVNPTNVMGATKRVAELVCQHFNAFEQTRFITVRFGNVLGSRGSVVETFKEQLEKGGPITVTHPEVMRYFMTIPEASQLILQALAIGEGGELFVLDMGEPIKIRYLAEQMISLAGKQKDRDIRIEYIGLRPGEKLYEELFHAREQLAITTHAKILKAHPRLVDHKRFEKNIIALQQAVDECNDLGVHRLLKECVPELTDLNLNAENQVQKEQADALLT
jgi:FlaA1/EpsC-like NDP-sugar epimerase